MIFYVKTCLECLQEPSYFYFFITGKEVNMAFWKAYDQILQDSQFLEMYIYLSLVGNLKVLFTDLCIRWSIHYQIGLNEKKIKFHMIAK